MLITPDGTRKEYPGGVLITPHSMSTDRRENEKLTDLFCENLRRYLAGEELLNVVDKQRGY